MANIKRKLVLLAMFATAPLQAAEEAEFDPNSVSEIDAIECRLKVPNYNGFAAAIGGGKNIAGKRHWKKIDTGNPFLNEYELPAPITVAQHYSTRRITLSATGIVAILDVPDPAVIAGAENIKNQVDLDAFINDAVAAGGVTRAQIESQVKFRKFLGERVISDVTEQAPPGEIFGAHTTVTRSISNVSTHPGKTLYGCSYNFELLDKDGKPLK